MHNRLYIACQKKGLHFKHVAEVGVYSPELCNVGGFIRENIRATLVEADPLCVEKIKAQFKAYPNVKIFPVAVWDAAGAISLYRAHQSTFVANLKESPALINDNYQPDEKDKFTVEAKLFSEIDDGAIDLLSIDIEGAEWFVLKHLTSRPRVISLETQAGQYANPYLTNIRRWMQANHYKLWFVNNTDTIYYKENTMTFTVIERLLLRTRDFQTLLRHTFKRLRRTLFKN